MDEDFLCLDCNVSTLWNGEYYMVKNKIWNKIHPDMEGMLCVGCLEERLGRSLIPADFTKCPLNTSAKGRSNRLMDRLGIL